MPKTYVSTIIPAPLDEVWKVLRDFRRVQEYHSYIVSIEFPGNLAGDQIGCMRIAVNAQGMRVVERLLALSDLDHSGSYQLVEVGIPVANFIGHFRAFRLTDGGETVVEWRSEFDYTGDQDAGEIVTFLENVIYMDCLNGLKKMFALS